MSSRKNSFSGSLPPNLVPRISMKASGGVAMTPTPVAVSVEYMEALKVLSEETMSKACSLLLSERDYEDSRDSSSTSADSKQQQQQKTDMEQLQEILKKCQEASKVIEKEQASNPNVMISSGNAPMMPSVPGGPRGRAGGGVMVVGPGGVTTTAAAAAGGAGGKAMLSLPAAARSRMQRMAHQKGAGGAGAGIMASARGSKLEREVSDSSSADVGMKRPGFAAAAGGGGGGVIMNSKKARKGKAVGAAACLSPTGSLGGAKNKVMLSNATGAPTLGGGGAEKEAAPPPSALNFLAKLNKDQKTSKTKTKAVPTPAKEESSPTPKESKPPSPPTRVLPPRSSRNK